MEPVAITFRFGFIKGELWKDTINRINSFYVSRKRYGNLKHKEQT